MTEATLSENNLTENLHVSKPPRGKLPLRNASGRPSFDTKGFAQYLDKPLSDKKKLLTEQWAQLAYILLGKATSVAMGVTKKDFGRLMQIVTTAGIAHDKLFPKGLDVSGNLVFNLFQGLPNDKVLRVLGDVPVPSERPLDSIPLDVTAEVSIPSDKPLERNTLPTVT